MPENQDSQDLPTGRIGFRTDPQVHAQLVEVANVLGLDLSGLLNLLIKDGLPKFKSYAARLSRCSMVADSLWFKRLNEVIDDAEFRRAMLLSDVELEDAHSKQLSDEEAAGGEEPVRRKLRRQVGPFAGGGQPIPPAPTSKKARSQANSDPKPKG